MSEEVPYHSLPLSPIPGSARLPTTGELAEMAGMAAKKSSEVPPMVDDCPTPVEVVVPHIDTANYACIGASMDGGVLIGFPVALDTEEKAIVGAAYILAVLGVSLERFRAYYDAVTEN
jgi:hypothetical protein